MYIYLGFFSSVKNVNEDVNGFDDNSKGVNGDE